MSYLILDASSFSELQDLVNEWLGEGYRPLGGIAVILDESKADTYIYYQAMFRENPYDGSGAFVPLATTRNP